MRNGGIALLLIVVASCAQETPRDLLIVGGLVYDGSEAAAEQRNILVDDGIIVSMDASPDDAAHRVIQADGKLIFPGFIDPHTHAPVAAEEVARTSHLNFLTQGITTVVVGNDGGGIENRVDTVAALDDVGSGANIAFFAGHNTIRKSVMGYEDRAPTAAEMKEMQALLEIEMTAGALGLSTGLYYAPGSFSKTDEVIALAETAARYDGIYDTHLRDESSYSIGLQAAVDEAIRIGEATGIPIHISHIKALGRDVWGQSAAVIAQVETARDAGIDVTANQYPWEASGVNLASALVPRWVMAGSKEEMHTRLRSEELRSRIRSEMERNLVRRGGANAILIVAIDSPYRGKRLDTIAEELDVDAISAAIELVLSHSPKIASFVMNNDDINAFRQQPWVMTGSDGGTGHPRYFASYPKAWRDFVVDRQLLSAEQFVHRSTGMVADTLGLCDRGYLRDGYAADIIIIDPDEFQPQATYEEPENYSTGVDHLLLAGEAIITDSQFQNVRLGQVLTRNRKRCEK